MSLEIKRRLKEIEREEDVVICLAVESGSRAWGFPSADSDYDVRFVYVHRSEWYLAIDTEDRRDVIERPIDRSLDINGWDARKALKMFRKSNPPLMEWLQCSIVYRERYCLAPRLRALLPDFYNPKASFYHYLHMARGNYREYLKGDTVWLKKYFYVLRPLLAVAWIRKELGPAPIEFERLVDAVVEEPSLRAAIEKLVAEKKAGRELRRGPRVPVISEFIEEALARHEGELTQKVKTEAPVERLNLLFCELLSEIWGEPPAA